MAVRELIERSQRYAQRERPKAARAFDDGDVMMMMEACKGIEKVLVAGRQG